MKTALAVLFTLFLRVSAAHAEQPCACVAQADPRGLHFSGNDDDLARVVWRWSRS